MGKIMMNGIQYGVGGIEQAKDISYDNTESGATATDVQGALDELNAGLANIGDVIAFDSKNVTTIPAARFVDIYGKTLPAGKYILSAKIFCNINNASCAIACGNLRQQLSAPSNVYMMVCGLIESDGTSETKIEFYQGGSSAMTRSYDYDSVYAVRIA